MGRTLVELLLGMQTALVCQGETLALLSFELAAQQAFNRPDRDSCCHKQQLQQSIAGSFASGAGAG